MKKRPSIQKKLFCHKFLIEELIKLETSNKLPNKIILSGQKGVGKATLAYHLINFVLSKNEDYSYDHINYEINSLNKSFILLQNKTNPNFHLIDVEKDKKKIDINQIRELIVKLTKFSFNQKKRFILIDNIELLNHNSVNALLKVLEEPSDNINFILINNNKRILPTLKSRCLNFNVSLTHDESIYVASSIINDNICNLINSDFIDNYITPGRLLKILDFSEEQKINIKKINLKTFLLNIIKNKIYKKEKLIFDFIYHLMELYFRNNISINNTDLFYFYNYFLKKINNSKIYNLDQDALFMEFEDKVLNV